MTWSAALRHARVPSVLCICGEILRLWTAWWRLRATTISASLKIARTLTAPFIVDGPWDHGAISAASACQDQRQFQPGREVLQSLTIRCCLIACWHSVITAG